MKEQMREFVAAYRDGRIDRRDFLRWSAILGLSLPLLEAPLARAAGPIHRGGTLRVLTASPASIEPPLLVDSPGVAVVQPVGEYLVAVDNDLIPRPALATHWTPSAGGATWTMTLRRGVTFHNGTTMTADDVAATFRRLVDPKGTSTARATLAFLTPEGVQKVDRFTVAFHLTRPLVDFPYYVSNITYQAAILPANWPGHFAKHPIGTGPFKLVEYVAGQRARYVRNPHYWIKGTPYLDGVEVILGLAPEAQSTQLLSGSADMQFVTPGDALPVLRGNPAVKVLAARSSFYDGIFLRTDKAPFHDKRVRQAMALCLNRPAIVKTVLQGAGVVGNDNVVAPAFPLYSSIPQRAQNYTEARALLRAAGHPNGFSMSLRTASDTADLGALAVVAQQMWKPAGINVSIKTEPGSVYYNTDWLQTPLNITEWAHRSTPSQHLDVAYRTNAVWNASHWSNPMFDRLTQELDSTLDFTKRKAIARKIELLMNDEVPAIIAAFSDSIRSVRSNVRGVNASNSNSLVLTYASLAP